MYYIDWVNALTNSLLFADFIFYIFSKNREKLEKSRKKYFRVRKKWVGLGMAELIKIVQY
jgi:hypothetical protein